MSSEYEYDSSTLTQSTLKGEVKPFDRTGLGLSQSDKAAVNDFVGSKINP